MVHPIYVAMEFSVLPGFAPADEALLFRQKAPKPVTPRLALLEGTDASLQSADQLALLKQGPPPDKSVLPWARRQALDHGICGTVRQGSREKVRLAIRYKVDEIGRFRRMPTAG